MTPTNTLPAANDPQGLRQAVLDHMHVGMTNHTILAEEGGPLLMASAAGIYVTDLDGKFIETIGSGRIGLADGGYDEAQFFRLQGLAYHDGSLYVADAENHALRVVDTKARRVTTPASYTHLPLPTNREE